MNDLASFGFENAKVNDFHILKKRINTYFLTRYLYVYKKRGQC
jgi:hypothetical protein